MIERCQSLMIDRYPELIVEECSAFRLERCLVPTTREMCPWSLMPLLEGAHGVLRHHSPCAPLRMPAYFNNGFCVNPKYYETPPLSIYV